MIYGNRARPASGAVTTRSAASGGEGSGAAAEGSARRNSHIVRRRRTSAASGASESKGDTEALLDGAVASGHSVEGDAEEKLADGDDAVLQETALDGQLEPIEEFNDNDSQWTWTTVSSHESARSSPASVHSEPMHPQDELWQAVQEQDTFDVNAILREEKDADVNFSYGSSLRYVRGECIQFIDQQPVTTGSHPHKGPFPMFPFQNAFSPLIMVVGSCANCCPHSEGDAY
jgi:hypothetical protein